MTDLSQAYSEVKSLPDSALQREMQSPSGMIPGYIVLAEMNERRAVRNSATAQPSGQTMAQEYMGYAGGGKVEALTKLNPFAALVRGMKNIHALDSGPAIEDGQLPSLPSLQPPMQPMGLESLIPQQPGRPDELKKYAGGGIVALTPYQKAFLDAIAARESGGRFNVMYGGQTFSDYSRHPGVYNTIQSGPNRGQKSSAAGGYQFLESTWNDQAKKLGLTDFSPQSQQLAAWDLAKTNYPGNLDAVLSTGNANDAALAASKLHSTWTSLPGGIEQGQNMAEFAKTYSNAMANAGASAQAVQAANAAQAAQTAQAATVAATPETTNPMSGLMALMLMQQQQTPAPAPAAPVRKAAPVDPQLMMEQTSLTPDHYRKRRRYG